MNMIKHDQNLTMSSREIAELTGKRHDNVKADVTKMLDELNLDVLNFQGIYFDAQNRKQTEYKLDRDLTLTLVSGYNIKLRHAIIERLDELEKSQVKLPMLPNFSNPAEAARAWAEQYEANAIKQQQLELAAPKVKFVESLVERKSLMNATQIAQQFGKSAVWLNKQLEDLDVYNKSVKRGRTFQKWFIDRGFGEMKQTEVGYPQALFSPAGEIWIHQKFVSEGIL
jgi:Rha family phage regulatory protein